jgi:hypothetical protein
VILDSYTPSNGVSVMSIEKIPGFVAVFKPLGDNKNFEDFKGRNVAVFTPSVIPCPYWRRSSKCFQGVL